MPTELARISASSVKPARGRRINDLTDEERCSRSHCARPRMPLRKMCEQCTLKQRARNTARSEWDHASKWRGYWLKRAYGITADEYNVMLVAQGYICYLCGDLPKRPSPNLVVDHDHETGKIRGLLCPGCNKGLGHFRDNPALMRRAASYVEKVAA